MDCLSHQNCHVGGGTSSNRASPLKSPAKGPSMHLKLTPELRSPHPRLIAGLGAQEFGNHSHCSNLSHFSLGWDSHLKLCSATPEQCVDVSHKPGTQ